MWAGSPLISLIAHVKDLNDLKSLQRSLLQRLQPADVDLRYPQISDPQNSSDIHGTQRTMKDPAEENHCGANVLLVASLLLVVWPGAPSSILAPGSDAACYW